MDEDEKLIEATVREEAPKYGLDPMAWADFKAKLRVMNNGGKLEVRGHGAEPVADVVRKMQADPAYKGRFGKPGQPTLRPGELPEKVKSVLANRPTSRLALTRRGIAAAQEPEQQTSTPERIATLKRRIPQNKREPVELPPQPSASLRDPTKKLAALRGKK